MVDSRSIDAEKQRLLVMVLRLSVPLFSPAACVFRDVTTENARMKEHEDDNNKPGLFSRASTGFGQYEGIGWPYRHEHEPRRPVLPGFLTSATTDAQSVRRRSSDRSFVRRYILGEAFLTRDGCGETNPSVGTQRPQLTRGFEPIEFPMCFEEQRMRHSFFADR